MVLFDSKVCVCVCVCVCVYTLDNKKTKTFPFRFCSTLPFLTFALLPTSLIHSHSWIHTLQYFWLQENWNAIKVDYLNYIFLRNLFKGWLLGWCMILWGVWKEVVLPILHSRCIFLFLFYYFCVIFFYLIFFNKEVFFFFHLSKKIQEQSLVRFLFFISVISI